jgi:hypothetical protein
VTLKEARRHSPFSLALLIEGARYRQLKMTELVIQAALLIIKPHVKKAPSLTKLLGGVTAEIYKRRALGKMGRKQTVSPEFLGRVRALIKKVQNGDALRTTAGADRR